MNIKQLSIIIIILVLLVACITKKSGEKEEGQDIKVKEETELLIREAEEGGNFIEADITSEYIQRAFKFLKGELARTHPNIIMGELKKAMSQVVSGLNILLVCEYKFADKDYLLKAIIYQNLDYDLLLSELYLVYKQEL